jgi:urea transporter
VKPYFDTTAIGRRFFASDAADKKKEEDKSSSSPPSMVQVWSDRLGRGGGQVIFLNSQTAGAVVLGSLAVGDPVLAVLAGTGTTLSTVTATLTGSQHSDALSNGLLAYNGCLIGCAAGGFLVPSSGLLAAVTWTTILAPASTALTLVLPKLTGSVPQWTWAFNAVALSQLVHLQPLLEPPAVTIEPVPTATISELAVAPLTGLSQIFVVNSAWTGVGITAAIGSYSPLLAVHGLLGSTVGTLTGGLLLGADAPTLAAGLYGYNAALTSLAVGVFFQNTNAAWTLSTVGAVTTAGLHAGLAAVFGSVGSPCLTVPFCVVASACHLLAGTVPGLKLAANPHSPERNTPTS